MVSEGLSTEVMFERKWKRDEGVSHRKKQEKGFPGRGAARVKALRLEVGFGLICLRIREKSGWNIRGTGGSMEG